MSNTCRLCRNDCGDSLRLCDAMGNPNEIYNIITKYFDSKYLHVNSQAVVCIECWRKITSFNTFRESIVLLLDNLFQEKEQTETVHHYGQDGNASDVLLQSKGEPSDVINIIDDDDDDEVNEEEFQPTESVGFGSGQLIVTNGEIQFSTYLDNNSDTLSAPEEELHSNDNYYFGMARPEEPEDIDSADEPNYQLIENKSNRPSKYSTAQIDKTIARWRPLLQCYVCSQEYAGFTKIKYHFDKCHPEHEFYILCCRRKFKYRFRLHQHAMFHMDPMTFQCQKCAKCFTMKAYLDSHMRSHRRMELDGLSRENTRKRSRKETND